MFKWIIVLFVVLAAVLLAFNYGQMTAYPEHLRGMTETQCDDINYNPHAEQKLVCEVFMQAEDDNIIIYKEN